MYSHHNGIDCTGVSRQEYQKVSTSELSFLLLQLSSQQADRLTH
jgi:hypothetical protein